MKEERAVSNKEQIMKPWFTVEKIDEDTYVISEYGHWEETHCYLLCGRERALLIDTGLGVANIKKVIDELTTLPILVVATHVHWDHIGGHKFFDSIAVFEEAERWLSGEFPISLQAVKDNLLREPCGFPEKFEIEDYQIYQGGAKQVLCDGEEICLGNRMVKVIHTPGHSPGHCCFFEEDKGYLYAGDLIYQGCLDVFYPTTDPKMFWKSIRKVEKLSIKRILPGHHALELPADIIGHIDNAFGEIASMGKLEQGNGVFEFGDFQIHI